MTCLNKRCSSFENGKEHETEDCVKNYIGSSKGMEADGVERRVKELWSDVTFDAYVAQFISDDDSTMQARLKWPCAEALEARLIPKWPTYVNRSGKETKKKCAGTLPLSHPAISNLADKNLRIRGYGSKMFSLAVAAKSESTMKKPDARRLQRNLSYAVHMNCDKSMEELKKGTKAALEHMFNNHEHCGLWCNYLPKTSAKKIACRWRYKCKERDAKLYKQILEIHQKFTTEESLVELLHEWDTQKNESVNNFIRGWVPKDTHYAWTRNWEGRVMTAVGVDSLGWEEYHRRAYRGCGLSVTRENVLGWRWRDRKKNIQRKYRKRSDVKRNMA
jgi:hypothetical protein